MLAPRKKSYGQPRRHIKIQRHYFSDKGPSNQSYGFSSSHVWMWDLDCKENWVLNNGCFWTVLLEQTVKHTLDYKEIKPIIPKGNQSWIFIGRSDAKARAPIRWPPDAKNWLIGNEPDAGQDWRQEKKWMTVGWQNQLYGPEFALAKGVGDVHGSLACCYPWDFKESDMTELLN